MSWILCVCVSLTPVSVSILLMDAADSCPDSWHPGAHHNSPHTSSSHSLSFALHFSLLFTPHMFVYPCINRPKSLWQLEMNLCPTVTPCIWSGTRTPHTSCPATPKSPIRMGPEGVNGFARSPWQLLTCSNVRELAGHDSAVRVKRPPLHDGLLLENEGEKQGGTGGCGGPGAVSIQTGPVVSGAHRHTVTLCLIGAGQSPRGMKGYARPVLLAVLSLTVSHP